MYRARYRRIVLFFARILISLAFWDLLLPRLGLRKQAQRTRPERLRRSAVAFRLLAIQMGGVLIKVGQFLSTRVDVLPVEITSELSGLQDEVPPVPYAEIKRLVEAEFNLPINEKFPEFDAKPLAAASLGQAHRARILSKGENKASATARESIKSSNMEVQWLNVVVKVQRPDIEAIITTDLAALHTVGNWLNHYRPISRRADVPALLKEFTRILYEEVDYLAEGRNAETFAANFEDHPGVRVPSVFWTHTTKRVLTLEDVFSIKISDYDAITAAGIRRAEVASRLLDTYLKQIFEDGFFHADPHPGNLFVDPYTPPVVSGRGENGANPRIYVPWQLTFVDFGMVGHVPTNIRAGLREMLIGVGTQNPKMVVHSYQTLGVLLPGADMDMLEKAEAKLFDRFWGKNMSELRDISPEEVHEFTSEFRDLIYSLPFQVPQDIIFLARAVSILSGMCTGLDPQFNLWEHLAPYAQKLIADELRTGPEAWLNEFSSLARQLFILPGKVDNILTKMDRGDISVRAPEIILEISRLERAIRQVAGSLIFTALLLGGIQLYLASQFVIASILLGGAAFSLLWTMVAGRKKR